MTTNLEAPPIFTQDELERFLREKATLHETAIAHLHNVQTELLQVMKNCAIIERQMSEVPVNKRESQKYKQLHTLFWKLRIKEFKLTREESKAEQNKYETYSDFCDARTAATENNVRAWMPPPQGFNKRNDEYNEGVKAVREDRRTIQHVLEASQAGQELIKQAEKKETRLEAAERNFQSIKTRIEAHLRNGVAGESINEIILQFQQLRSILDKRADDYVATKAKALEAFRLAESFKERLSPEDRNLLQRELKLIFPSAIPTRVPQARAVLKPAEVRLNREIQENILKIQQMSIEYRKKPTDAMVLKLEGILRNRRKHSKDFLKFVQEKLAVLKRPVGNVAGPSGRIPRPINRTPSVVAQNRAGNLAFRPQRNLQQPQNEDEFAQQVNDVLNQINQQVQRSSQNNENKQKCQKIFDNFYNQLKSRHLKTVKCREIMGKNSSRARKSEIVKQLKIVLKNFSREIEV